MKLVSFDIQADFGFFRKPETNNTINVSYNLLHKPAALGILGAVLGLGGYKEKGKLPEYYALLSDIRFGMEPLNHEKGNFAKTNIKYSNTVGYANKGSNFLTEELTLIAPAYRIYLLLDETKALHKSLMRHLQRGESEFVPYFGKNEFTAWWTAETFKLYTLGERTIHRDESVAIRSIFQKELIVSQNTEAPFPDISKPFNFEEMRFVYFERLPKGFNEKLMQYELADFAYSTYQIKNAHQLCDLQFVEELEAYVQLF